MSSHDMYQAKQSPGEPQAIGKGITTLYVFICIYLHDPPRNITTTYRIAKAITQNIPVDPYKIKDHRGKNNLHLNSLRKNFT